MSPRSRHAPLPEEGSKHSKGTRSHYPRHVPRTMIDTSSFATATYDSGLTAANFSLSSSTSNSRHHAEPCHWKSAPSSFSRHDDYLTFPGLESMNLQDSYYTTAMMSDHSPMDMGYTFAASDVFSRHAPLSTKAMISGQDSNSYGQDVLMNDYLPMEFAQFDYLDQWPNRDLTPPPEPFIEDALPFLDNTMTGRHYQEPVSIPQDSTICENLGPSKLLTYRGSRHGPVQPRPIRSASDRSDPTSASTSPRDDHTDKVKARSDPLYDVKPDKAGFYHCPLMKEYKCSHKPTKQKCIYAKYLDSHLRPYRCKYATPGSDCEETRFSSNACLFRHEREAHGMHNHGMNPYLCDYPDCDRAKPENGFPRRWNQRDHMKRVHAWTEDDSTSPSDRHAATDPSKKRRSLGGPSSVQMRRSSSSYSKAQVNTSGSSRRSQVSTIPARHRAQATYNSPNQMCNVMAYPVPMDSVQFSKASLPRISRHSDSYVGTYYQTVY